MWGIIGVICTGWLVWTLVNSGWKERFITLISAGIGVVVAWLFPVLGEAIFFVFMVILVYCGFEILNAS